MVIGGKNIPNGYLYGAGGLVALIALLRIRKVMADKKALSAPTGGDIIASAGSANPIPFTIPPKPNAPVAPTPTRAAASAPASPMARTFQSVGKRPTGGALGAIMRDGFASVSTPQPASTPPVDTDAITTPAPTPTLNQAKVITNDPPPLGDLVVRSSPSDSAPQIGGVDKNGIVTVLNDAGGGYSQVQWDGGRWPAVTGFVHNRFLVSV